MLNKTIIFTLLFIFSIFFITPVFASQDLSEPEGKLYGQPGGYYVNMKGEAYGPYHLIYDISLTETNWGFSYVEVQEGVKTGNYDYYYMINGEVYGPFNEVSANLRISKDHIGYGYSKKERRHTTNINGVDYDSCDLTPSRRGSGFEYERDCSGREYYLNLDGVEHGPCKSFVTPILTDNNYGFNCKQDDGGYIFVNNEKHYYQDEYVEYSIKENHWGYKQRVDGKDYVVVNNDTFGPYDRVRDFALSDDTWAIAFENENKYFVLANNRPIVELPLTKEQAEGYKYGVFYSRELYPSSSFGMQDYGGKNDLELDGDCWRLDYMVDGKKVMFSCGNVETAMNESNKRHERLRGKILLKVEDEGRAYYVNPRTFKKHYLGRPSEAFSVMREQGLGISERDFASMGTYAPARLSGTILLRVEENGEAYYVNPADNKLHYLGRPADAFRVMRELGLGITNSDFDDITLEN